MVIAASAPPDRVAALQARLGREAAGALVESAMADIARRAGGARRATHGRRRGRDLRRGRDTARRSHVADRRGNRSGRSWTYAEGSAAPMRLALKSGNFGGRDFFLKAFGRRNGLNAPTEWRRQAAGQATTHRRTGSRATGILGRCRRRRMRAASSAAGHGSGLAVMRGGGRGRLGLRRRLARPAGGGLGHRCGSGCRATAARLRRLGLRRRLRRGFRRGLGRCRLARGRRLGGGAARRLRRRLRGDRLRCTCLCRGRLGRGRLGCGRLARGRLRRGRGLAARALRRGLTGHG